MNITRRTTSMLKTGAVVAALLLGMGSGPALADSVFATAVLYEVRETIDCNPGGSPNPLVDPLCANEPSQGFGTRIAHATLLGTSQGAPEFTGGISVEASSVLSRSDWTGPARGTITVGTAAGLVLARFSGQLDLSLIATGQAPIAPISGKWHGSKGTLQAKGAFDGIFLVPVGCTPAFTGLTGCVYYDPSSGPVAVADAEYAVLPGLGTVPLVKLIATFVEE